MGGACRPFGQFWEWERRRDCVGDVVGLLMLWAMLLELVLVLLLVLELVLVLLLVLVLMLMLRSRV